METIIKQMLEIVCFIIILFIAGFIYKRMVISGKYMRKRNQYIESIERYYLSNDKWIEIVTIGNKIMILGVTPTNITTLDEITQDDLCKIERKEEQGYFSTAINKSLLNKAYKNIKKTHFFMIVTLIILLSLNNFSIASAEPEQMILDNYLNTSNETSGILNLMVILTALVFLPLIIMTITVFPRILIVLSFTRNAMGTQQTPPNQVLIGIALILTFFIMSPIISEIRVNAYDPYMAGEINTTQAYQVAMEPMRGFMFEQAKTEPDSIDFYLELYGEAEIPESLEEIPTIVLMMAFITSELKKAFIIGFIIYIPFIMIDMIVASVLMSMGMMMIPPTTISLPFKILLFVIVDGWTLLFKTLVSSFG